jgi:hypothetical protein
MSENPELEGYEPHDQKPLRSPHLKRIMQVVVTAGLVSLVLPGIIVTAGTATATATNSCAVYASVYAQQPATNDARFEFLGPEGPGWYCFVTAFSGEEYLLRPLGLIPGVPVFPQTPEQNVPGQPT